MILSESEPKFLKRVMLRKIRTFINVLKYYRSWHMPILEALSMLKGTVRVSLRDGSLYMVRAGKNDIGRINAVYIWKDYHENIAFIKDRTVVIDIGANIGAFSILASRLAKDVTVFSYEPAPENFSLLLENIALNGASGNIHAFNTAISGDGSPRELFIDERDPGANSMYSRRPNSIQVTTITLKDIIDSKGIKECDFLKLDCEGAEYEILYNTPKEYLDRIKSISLEYHDYERVKDLASFLEDAGFTVRRLPGKPFLLYAVKN